MEARNPAGGIPILFGAEHKERGQKERRGAERTSQKKSSNPNTRGWGTIKHFKKPKNHKDSCNVNDVLTELIAATRSIIAKTFAHCFLGKLQENVENLHENVVIVVRLVDAAPDANPMAQVRGERMMNEGRTNERMNQKVSGACTFLKSPCRSQNDLFVRPFARSVGCSLVDVAARLTHSMSP